MSKKTKKIVIVLASFSALLFAFAITYAIIYDVPAFCAGYLFESPRIDF